MPLHPLVVHAVVVLVPLAALSGVAFAVLPRWRWLLRWPTAVLAVVAALATQTALMTGEDLLESRGLGGPALEDHQDYATWLRIAVLTFAVLALVAAWLLPYDVPLTGREDRDSPLPALAVPVAALLVVAAGASLVLVVLTGDAGARSVWGGG